MSKHAVAQKRFDALEYVKRKPLNPIIRNLKIIFTSARNTQTEWGIEKEREREIVCMNREEKKSLKKREKWTTKCHHPFNNILLKYDIIIFETRSLKKL